MHISSLPSKYGIGDFGREAYNFVDFLVKARQKNWQVLPLGITGFGDSPYQSFSAFAGNPYFIDLDEFLDRGFLSEADLRDLDFGDNPKKVDYGLLFKNKLPLIYKAYMNAKDEIEEDLNDFYRDNKSWLREFALYMSIKVDNDNRSWIEWSDEYRDINSKTVLEYEKKNREKIYFWVFTQYFFMKQYNRLKSYANENGVKIIGDIPIYVAFDSADVWSNPNIYNLDDNLEPITVSGCPPDAFSVEGQLWGNPIYDWDQLEKEDYSWWISRLKFSFDMFDTVRIDHFRGFESYWEVEYGSKNAVKGQWTKGPGMKLFNKLKEELGELDIIAEDLGFLTDDVRQLLKDSAYPGMKLMQFAFDSREDSDYLPHNYESNSVVYTGTHDNPTILGWIDEAPKDDIKYATEYLRLNIDEGYNWGFIRGAWSSASYLAMTSMQDLIGLGRDSRMNIPSTLGNNWDWRMEKEDISNDIWRKMAELTRVYKR